MKIQGKGLSKQTENIAVREVGFDKFYRRSLAPNRYTAASFSKCFLRQALLRN